MESRARIILDNLKIHESVNYKSNPTYDRLLPFLERIIDQHTLKEGDEKLFNELFNESLKTTREKLKENNRNNRSYKNNKSADDSQETFILELGEDDNDDIDTENESIDASITELKNLLSYIARVMKGKNLWTFFDPSNHFTAAQIALLDIYPLIEKNDDGHYQFALGIGNELRNYFLELNELQEYQQLTSPQGFQDEFFPPKIDLTTIEKQINHDRKNHEIFLQNAVAVSWMHSAALLETNKWIGQTDENGNYLKGDALIHAHLLAPNKNEVDNENWVKLPRNPYRYMLIQNKDKRWYLYHLNEKNDLIIRSVEKDPSLKKLKAALQDKNGKNYALETIELQDTKGAIRAPVMKALHDYFDNKAQVRFLEQKALEEQPHAIHKMHSSPWDHNNHIIKQAHYIWQTYIQPLLNSGKKVALLYSANQKQAEMLYKSYNHFGGPSLSSIFHGSGQAEIFRIIAEYIEKNNLRDQVHILPIPTSLEGGDDVPGNQVSPEQIDVALRYVAMHKGAGFTINSLADDKGYLIGGGRSKRWSEATGEFNRKDYVDRTLNDISNYEDVTSEIQDEIQDEIQEAYQQGKDFPQTLSLFHSDLTEDLIDRISAITNDDTLPFLKGMQDAIEQYMNANNTIKLSYLKDTDKETLWKTLVKICKDQLKPFKRNSAQVDLLCRAIAEFDANLRMNPEIETLDQLMIMQQKREAIKNWVDVEYKRLENNHDKKSVLKLNAYHYIKDEIIKSDKNTPLSELIAEDSPLLQLILTSPDNKIKYGTIQQSLYRKRGTLSKHGLGLSQATSKSKLNQLRDKLFELDPRTVLNFNQKTTDHTGEIQNLFYDPGMHYKDSSELFDKIVGIKYYLPPEQKEHIEHLIKDLTYLIMLQRGRKNDQEMKQLIISKIKEALDKEERRFRDPTLGFFGKSGQDFRNMLTQLPKNKVDYRLHLLKTLQDSTPQINPNISLENENTSDHALQTISIKFSTNDDNYRLNGLTWNLMDGMFSKTHEDSFSNNPWNASEDFEQYYRRKRKQLDHLLFDIILENKVDFMFLQEVDIFRPKQGNFTDEQFQLIVNLKEKFIKHLRASNWEIAYSPDLAAKGYQQSLITLYNTKTFTFMKNPSGIIPVDDGKDLGMRGTEFKVKHAKSDKVINLSNLHLKWGNELDNTINNELIKHRNTCKDNGEILIAGGDFNRPSNHISNAIADPERVTNLESEILHNDLIHLKRKHDNPTNDKTIKRDKEYKAYDYFLVNGTNDCFIKSVSLGGQEFDKIGKGQYAVIDSTPKKFLPYQIINGTYSYAEKAECIRLTIKLDKELRQELTSYINEYQEKIESKFTFISQFFDSNYVENCKNKKKTAEAILACLLVNDRDTFLEKIYTLLYSGLIQDTLHHDQGRLKKIYQKFLSIADVDQSINYVNNDIRNNKDHKKRPPGYFDIQNIIKKNIIK